MTAKTKKIADKIFSITWWVIFILLFTLVMGIVITKARGEVPKVFGYSIMKITTPSMGKEIPAGSYIIIKETPPDQIKKNDIICFYSSDPSIYGYPNTHRVIADPVKDGDIYVYQTKGDANAMPDPQPATSDKLIGKYVKTMSFVTGVSEMAKSSGMIVVIVVMLVLTAGTVVAVVIVKSKFTEKEKE